MKRFLLFLSLSFFIINCFSQNRDKIWYFGEFAGLDFHTSPPTSLFSYGMSQGEGCVTMCDTTGQLLFISDGMRVLNRNHQLMLNGDGLLGAWSSTQSALAIPAPGSDHIYYLFTVPCQDSITPFSYSIIDMNLDGGLGAVTIKNVALHSNVMEKLTATVKSNGVDYWIVVKEWRNDKFLAYSLTSSGINPNPVISHTGILTWPLYSMDCIGSARISHDGSKLCISYKDSRLSQLFDFDNNTGVISNPIDLPGLGSGSVGGGPYGIEFSPDNSKLYIMESVGMFFQGALRQYDLSMGSPAAIQNSVVLLDEMDGGALQLAPDGKIYVAMYNVPSLSVINEPNLSGLTCDFVPDAITLLSPSLSYMGLPNNIIYAAPIVCPATSVFSNNINMCANQTYQLPSGTIVSAAGIYSDTLRNQAGTCDSIIRTINLSVYNNASLLNSSVHICPNQTYQLPSGTIVSAEGIYLDTLRSTAGCDSIVNNIHLWVDHALISNTTVNICFGETYQLPSGTIVNNTGTYPDTIRSQAYCDSVINIVHLTVNDISYLTQQDTIDAGQSYTLPSGIIVTTEGTYQSILANSLGCDSIVTTVLKIKRPAAYKITLTNAFTPNGDGINDYFILYTNHWFKKMEVSVFNRNAVVVYHSDDYKNDWNGNYKNKELPDGTYYYYVKVYADNGDVQVFKNNVTILR